MKQHRTTTFRILFLGLLGVLAVQACAPLPKQYGKDVRALGGPALVALNPSDVAVGPVMNLTQGAVIPDLSLRGAFQKALIRRRYSPLALDLVDAQVVEASYRPGGLNEEAVLEITVYGWDERLWESRSAILYDVEARMVDAKQPQNAPLWVGRLQGRVDLANQRAQFRSEPALFQAACDRIGLEIISAMPPRVTAPGRE